MGKRTLTACLAGLISTMATAPALAQTNPEPSPYDTMKGVWAFTVGWGEIPFLSGSFKPSVSFGYHLNEYVYFGGVVQLADVLERGTESFNAQNTGLGGIESTRERTGVRSFFGTRLRPHRYAPFVSLGMLFNGSDTEVMHFDDRQRRIGSHTYDGALSLEVTRGSAIRPAVGLGYEVTFKRGFTLSTELTGAFFMRPPTPEVRVESESQLTEEDRAALVQNVQETFSDNFHNRYHLFQIGAGYAW